MKEDWIVEDGIELNDQFVEVLDLLENTNQNVFLTGKAGSGKSTLLKTFRQNTKKKYVVVAPSGVAAVNVGAQTIHSMFRFPPQIIFENNIHRLNGDNIFSKLQVLIIDEISMVRADVFQAIDIFLRKNGPDATKLFGGVQLILIGDLYQLPPIVNNGETELFYSKFKSPHFFDTDAFKDGNFKSIELHKMYRQTDETFLNLLEKIRTNKMEKNDFEEINKRYMPFEQRPDGEKYITLSAINEIANKINYEKMAKIKEPEFTYTAEVEGLFKEANYPTDEYLKLKVGAQVMFIVNDKEKQFVNGTIGIVSKLSKNRVEVEIDGQYGKQTVDVEEYTWEQIKYVTDKETDKIKVKKIGSYTQYPLKLAFAISIHKSQSKTFENIDLHFGYGAFAFGMAYVAFSRCKTLEGIRLLKKLEPKDIIIDKNIQEFIERSVKKKIIEEEVFF